MSLDEAEQANYTDTHHPRCEKDLPALVFIDTNIFLDFYRVRGSDASLSILKHFDTNHNRIITTSQVEMEYKANRQKVILDSLKLIKPHEPGEQIVPAFLQESSANRTVKRAHDQLSRQSNKLRERTAKLLENPSANDPVYRVLQRLFKAKGDCHLSREKKVRLEIRELAEKRFKLGYPPRKPGDSSIGDAINWEWIVHCAQFSSDDIVIVSRDSDYGALHNGRFILNDWLRQEFKERVSRKRAITLTARLTEAFKHASITVTKEEEESEDKLINTTAADRAQLSKFPTFDPTWSDDVKNKWFAVFDEVLKKILVQGNSQS